MSSAAQAAKVPPPSTVTTLASQAEFTLETDGGYLVRVEGNGRRVVLTVERGAGLASYFTRGRASPDGIRARFGHFGRVSVRFKASGGESLRRPPKGCEGKAAIMRSGVYVGQIRFKGEDGYIDVDAHRAKGTSSTQPRWRCKPRREASNASARPKQLDFDVMVLTASTPNNRVKFEASGLRLPGGPVLIFFSAVTIERKGSVQIVRLALTTSERARTFPFGKAGRSATVRPPKPFQGAATYQRNADGSAVWSGSLSVSLPGAEVDLTGPAFTAKLKRPKTMAELFKPNAHGLSRNGG